MQKAVNKKRGSKRRFNPVYVLISIAVVAGVISFRSCNHTEKQMQHATTAIEFKKEGQLTFVNEAEGFPITNIDIEIAEDDRARALGLMHRYSMKADQGMLFIMDKEETQSFWMKDTYIPLDILFVNSSMVIVKIQRNNQPFSQQSIPSIQPAKYVVEVVAGFCNKHDIKEGDRIDFTRISTN
jgi:uncharacterized membrane protein (UPF0127 family)